MICERTASEWCTHRSSDSERAASQNVPMTSTAARTVVAMRLEYRDASGFDWEADTGHRGKSVYSGYPFMLARFWPPPWRGQVIMPRRPARLSRLGSAVIGRLLRHRVCSGASAGLSKTRDVGPFPCAGTGLTQYAQARNALVRTDGAGRQVRPDENDADVATKRAGSTENKRSRSTLVSLNNPARSGVMPLADGVSH